MKNQLREKLEAGQAVFGVWTTHVKDPVLAELLASCGPDFVTFDLQHGVCNEDDLPALTCASVAGGAVPLARVRASSPADIGRALDLGAHGVFVPNIADADHAREMVRACQYGPLGTRSVGRLSGGVDDPLCFLIIETAQALAELDEILALEGVDGVYVGPKDLALSMRGPSAVGSPETNATITDIVSRCHRVHVPVGVHSYDAVEAERYVAKGARIVTAAVDESVVRAAVTSQIRAARQDNPPSARDDMTT